MHDVREIRRFLSDEQGATLVEYSLVASLIGVMVLGAAEALGGSLSDGWARWSALIGAALHG